jgi:hypothetical protein
MVGDRGWHTRCVDDALEHTICDECGSNVMAVLLSSGRALCEPARPPSSGSRSPTRWS